MLPGAQAQVDWGDEGAILAHAGIAKVYSFHMTLSYLLHGQPACGRLLGLLPAGVRPLRGVPAAIVYDRTKTVVRRHVAPGAAVPLHPEAAAFAAH